PKQKKSDDESESLAGARTDVQKNIRFTEAVVNKDHLVTDPMAAQNEFDDETQSGQTNSEADPDNGKLKTDGSVTGIAVSGNEGNRTDVRTGASTNLDNAIVNIAQKKAIPTEGFQKFYDRFVRKFSSQSVNTNVNEVEVKLRFVVEKDGSFTDIQIIDDKFGYGEEAKRVLQTMPKWKPAEHNGKTVRSMFTLPIKIKINN
ncbi:MAG TPA: energy transducer TonB, partial [Flavobacterium sp.]|nr:energy transducer TonB [Flavobacterium sp.]